MVYIVVRMSSCGSYPPKITWTGGTATWISRPVTVVCRNVPYLVKWLHEHNSHGMIGIGRLRAGLGRRVEHPRDGTAVGRRQRHRESLAASLGAALSGCHELLLPQLASVRVSVRRAVD